MMADECCDVSKIVTAFLVSTCRLPPWPSERDVQAAVGCAVRAGRHPDDDDDDDDDDKVERFPLTTGSVAEFYIEPMLPLVGDIDVMFHYNTELAIPRGHPPPTQLPAEFHNCVQVYEIIDSQFPGYVYLRYLHTQLRVGGDSSYSHKHVEYDEEYCLLNKLDGEDEFMNVHGPAWLTDNSDRSHLSIDAVPCIRCLSWPPQAADWQTRHRNHGWPDSTTLGRVVSNGCDVVRVAHRQCKQHKVLGKFQWRLSFSRAEVVLINSWMPVQQITYHLLRVYVKTERLTESADDSGAGTLSNYHIKTLMLWACELKPRSWWTENLNLVRICAELLQTLSVWSTSTRCPHYFISNCNLLDNSFNVESLARKLMLGLLDEEHLSTWLIENYIGQCAQRCPRYILRLFDDVNCGEELYNALSEIVLWRSSTSLRDLWRTFATSDYYISMSVSRYSLTARSCARWMNELTKIDKRFSVYFSAVALLHVARKISTNGFSGKLKDIVSTIDGHDLSQCCGVLSLSLIHI